MLHSMRLRYFFFFGSAQLISSHLISSHLRSSHIIQLKALIMSYQQGAVNARFMHPSTCPSRLWFWKKPSVQPYSHQPLALAVARALCCLEERRVQLMCQIQVAVPSWYQADSCTYTLLGPVVLSGQQIDSLSHAKTCHGTILKSASPSALVRLLRLRHVSHEHQPANTTTTIYYCYGVLLLRSTSYCSVQSI
ncbi:hypothetical protein V8C37DRAFT_84266 [Trichoderma ceciliae]